MIVIHKIPRPHTMDDSTDVGAIPANAQIVAGYIDGNFVDFPAIVARFMGKADLVSIGIFMNSIADFVDVEPGNPVTTPREVRASFEFRKAHGVWKPGFYGDLTRMRETIIPGLAGIPRNEYRLWLADWVNHPEILPGFDAQQWESLSRPNIDVSLVADSFFPPDAKPRKKRKHHIHIPKPIKRVVTKPYRKVITIPPSGGAAIGIVKLLAASGIHVTTVEAAAIAAGLATVVAYLFPERAK